MRRSYLVTNADGTPAYFKGVQPRAYDHINLELELRDFRDTDKSFVAVASAESVDRYDDIIMVDGWKLKNYFPKNPVLMGYHDYRTPPLGTALEVWREEHKGVKRLMFRPSFHGLNEESSLIYSLFKNHVMRGFSVGFRDLKSEPIKQDGDKNQGGLFFHEPTRYLQQELLEISAVPIPAHQDALSEIRGYVRRGLLHVPTRYLEMDDDEEIEIEIDDDDPEIEIEGDFEEMVRAAVRGSLGRLD